MLARAASLISGSGHAFRLDSTETNPTSLPSLPGLPPQYPCNLPQFAAKLPLNRIMLETDSPWCSIKATHSSFKHVATTFSSTKEKKWDGMHVKNRNEPDCIIQVLEAVAGIKEIEKDEVATATTKNAMQLFFGEHD